MSLEQKITSVVQHIASKIKVLRDRDMRGLGRPDIPSSLSPDNQSKVATATNGTKFFSTDGWGIWVYEWMRIDGKWKTIFWDTGWVQITAGNAADVFVRRVNNLVYISVDRWSGTRIHIPKGFRSANNIVGVTSTNYSSEPIARYEVNACGVFYAYATDQTYPWHKTGGSYWTTRTANKVSFRSNQWAKLLFSYPVSEDYPTTLAIPHQSRNLLPVTVNYSVQTNNPVSWNPYYSAQWQLAGKVYEMAENDAVFPHGQYAQSGGSIDFSYDSGSYTSTRSHIHIRASAKVGTNYGASTINWANIHYSTDWVNFTDSGIVCSGHSDGEREPQEYTINIPNIRAIRLVRTGGILSVWGIWIGRSQY